MPQFSFQIVFFSRKNKNMTGGAMGWTTEELSFDYQEGQAIFLYSTASGHILSPIEYRVLFFRV
jgi:hypothetical protein